MWTIEPIKVTSIHLVDMLSRFIEDDIGERLTSGLIVDVNKLFSRDGVSMIICNMSNVLIIQTVEETKGFGVPTDVFWDVVVALGEIDTVTVLVS